MSPWLVTQELRLSKMHEPSFMCKQSCLHLVYIDRDGPIDSYSSNTQAFKTGTKSFAELVNKDLDPVGVRSFLRKFCDELLEAI